MRVNVNGKEKARMAGWHMRAIRALLLLIGISGRMRFRRGR
jgi:hypothetical protein